jgi:predicted Zn-dependent peptidase
MLSLENTPSRMNRLARHELLLNQYVDLSQTIDSINKVKGSEVIEVANELFDPSKLSVVILGPVGQRVIKQIDWDII